MRSLEKVSKAKLSALRKLTYKKYRVETKTFLVEGLRSVEEALASDWSIDSVLMTPEFLASSHREVLRLVKERSLRAYSISAKELAAVSDTVHAQGIIAVVRQKLHVDPDRLPSSAFLVAADGISEPGNLGTIIRTCDWFGVDAILVGKNSVEVFNPKVVRATVGSIFHVTVITVDLSDVLQKLRKRGFHMYATVLDDGVEITKVPWKEKGILVLGNEAHGVSPEHLQLADSKVLIPRIGKAESLNVGVACGIVLATIRIESFRRS